LKNFATDAFFFTRAQQFVVLTARHAIPTLFSRREFAAAGGLMSYGSNADEYHIRAYNPDARELA
jgi:putative tryptophan/tyrosine transport system substrate-binding protein